MRHGRCHPPSRPLLSRSPELAWSRIWNSFQSSVATHSSASSPRGPVSVSQQLWGTNSHLGHSHSSTCITTETEHSFYDHSVTSDFWLSQAWAFLMLESMVTSGLRAWWHGLHVRDSYDLVHVDLSRWVGPAPCTPTSAHDFDSYLHTHPKSYWPWFSSVPTEVIGQGHLGYSRAMSRDHYQKQNIHTRDNRKRQYYLFK